MSSTERVAIGAIIVVATGVALYVALTAGEGSEATGVADRDKPRAITGSTVESVDRPEPPAQGTSNAANESAVEPEPAPAEAFCPLRILTVDTRGEPLTRVPVRVSSNDSDGDAPFGWEGATDARGDLCVDCPPGGYTIRCEGDFTPSTRTVVLREEEPELVVFVGKRKVEVEVRVLDPQGDLATAASVRCEGDELVEVRDWEPRSPPLRLSPGSYRLRAFADRVGASDRVRIDVPRDGDIDPVELRLKAAYGVVGCVRFADEIAGLFEGWPFGCRVVLHPGVAAPDRARLPRNTGQQSSRAVDSSDPCFEFLNLREGRYTLLVEFNLSIVFREVVTLDPSAPLVHVDAWIEDWDRSEYAVAWVYSGGEFAKGAQFMVHRGGGGRISVPAILRPDGSYQVHLPERVLRVLRGETEGECSLQATLPGGGQGKATIPPSDLPVVTIETSGEPPEPLVVSVPALKGESRGKTTVELLPDEETSRRISPVEGITLEEGEVRLQHPEPGRYLLQVNSSLPVGNGLAVINLHEEVVTIEASTQALHVDLEAPSSLELLAGRLAGGSLVRVSYLSEGTVAWRLPPLSLDTEEPRWIGLIPGGQYRLELLDEKGEAAAQPRVVDVWGPTTVTVGGG